MPRFACVRRICLTFFAASAISLQSSQGLAEEVPLICDIVFEDGDRTTWALSIDVLAEKIFGFLDKERPLIVDETTVAAISDNCVWENGKRAGPCTMYSIIIDRRTLEVSGSKTEIDISGLWEFNGKCLIGRLENKF